MKRGAADEPTLIVRFTRLSPTHHRFELVCGAATQTCELETRSCLMHDLVHFALESEARLANSFYGQLARGVPYATLTEVGMAAATGEIQLTERLVGALQGAWTAGFDAERFVEAFRSYQDTLGEPPPPWLTAELLVRVAARLRALEGAWRATKSGGTLELRFPPRE